MGIIFLPMILGAALLFISGVGLRGQILPRLLFEKVVILANSSF